jgi:hypothetical protein
LNTTLRTSRDKCSYLDTAEEYVHEIVTLMSNYFNNILGLSKAFDCTGHNTLKDKLYRSGVHGIPNKLIKSKLASRTQQVSYTHRKQSTERMFVK